MATVRRGERPGGDGDLGQRLRRHRQKERRDGQKQGREGSLRASEQTLAEARAEKVWVSGRDQFLPHTLDAAELAPLLEVVCGEPLVRRAMLARKRLKHPSRQPVFVLSVGIERKWHQIGRAHV